MLRIFWLSTITLTVFAIVDHNDIVVESSPVIRVFVGQNFDRLRAWLSKQGGLRVCLLHVEEVQKRE